jgi:outer membrane lipoprotein-sorting protein
MNAGNLPGSQPVQCPVAKSGSMTILHSFTRTPLRAAIVGALALAVPTALALPATPAAAQADLLDQAVTALRSISTMRADFSQTDRNGQAVRGVLTLKNPGKISFDYQGGDMRIVSNGRSLVFADYEVKQLQRWPISNSPLGALLDPNRDVKRYGKLLPTSNPNVISIEVRDPKKPEYGTITLILVRDAAAPGGLELTSWVALDAQNKRTTVRLSNQRYGMAVPDSAFTYRDPRRTGGRP